MISNKFKVGWRYKFDGGLCHDAGIIEITDIDDDDCISYKVIEGMEDDSSNKSFDEGAGFSEYLSLIKEETE